MASLRHPPDPTFPPSQSLPVPKKSTLRRSSPGLSSRLPLKFEQRTKELSEKSRPVRLKANTKLIGSRASESRLLKVQSAELLPQESAESPGVPEQSEESKETPSSEMTSAGSSGLDPSCGSSGFGGETVGSPKGIQQSISSSGSILKVPAKGRSDTQKKVAFLPLEESPEPVEDLEVAMILRHSEAHWKKKARPARRAIMSYHSNNS